MLKIQDIKSKIPKHEPVLAAPTTKQPIHEQFDLQREEWEIRVQFTSIVTELTDYAIRELEAELESITEQLATLSAQIDAAKAAQQAAADEESRAQREALAPYAAPTFEDNLVQISVFNANFVATRNDGDNTVNLKSGCNIFGFHRDFDCPRMLPMFERLLELEIVARDGSTDTPQPFHFNFQPLSEVNTTTFCKEIIHKHVNSITNYLNLLLVSHTEQPREHFADLKALQSIFAPLCNLVNHEMVDCEFKSTITRKIQNLYQTLDFCSEDLDTGPIYDAFKGSAQQVESVMKDVIRKMKGQQTHCTDSGSSIYDNSQWTFAGCKNSMPLVMLALHQFADLANTLNNSNVGHSRERHKILDLLKKFGNYLSHRKPRKDNKMLALPTTTEQFEHRYLKSNSILPLLQDNVACKLVSEPPDIGRSALF
eukprot:CAMPEP_0113665096 /NCGR_PEP_ID=MMETSP0038_2-20120614/2108_1 /TAXON_ID=2898 /ORGANISM="Cryptomonas paramecium" /LENGTH=425 /DNA_ID=CAMNT_0000580397 /DNA_START=644 /DNA_END=1918 /DNA_ORIENTATION=+ /assembly_acc=CAM_ASM_000170